MDEDRELIRRILLGDAVAPDEFTYAWFYRIRRRIQGQFQTLSDDEVDDLVQGIFEKLAQHGWRRLAAWRGLEDDGGPELAGYLYRIASNYVLDYLKSQHALRVQQDRFQHLHHDDHYEIDHDLPGCLSGVLDRLPGRDREIITLRFNGGLSYREIGERMGLSANHVGVLLFRALERLQTMVVEDYPELPEEY